MESVSGERIRARKLFFPLAQREECATIRAMVTQKEVRFLRLLFALWIILMAFGVVTTAISIADIWRSQTMNNNIFELLYMAFHLIVLGFFIMVTLNAFKKGSFILRGLSYGAYEGASLFVRALSIFIVAVGIALAVFGILFLIPNLLYDFSFPITLKWAMVNAGLTLLILGLAFFLFPFLFAKNPTLSKQKENELNERKRQR